MEAKIENNINRIFVIHGMTCAACAKNIERVSKS